MIYILKKSKRSDREQTLKYSVSGAKEFLYRLVDRHFVVNDFIIFGSDEPNELQEILDYFTEEYISKGTYQAFDVYRVNNIYKNERLKEHGANITSLLNFREKIEKKIHGSTISMQFTTEVFELYVLYKNVKMRITCTYELEIIDKTLYPENGDAVDIQVLNDVVASLCDISINTNSKNR